VRRLALTAVTVSRVAGETPARRLCAGRSFMRRGESFAVLDASSFVSSTVGPRHDSYSAPTNAEFY
jgi:hypothetical protein